jgi:hypothetical protein
MVAGERRRSATSSFGKSVMGLLGSDSRCRCRPTRARRPRLALALAKRASARGRPEHGHGRGSSLAGVSPAAAQTIAYRRKRPSPTQARFGFQPGHHDFQTWASIFGGIVTVRKVRHLCARTGAGWISAIAVVPHGFGNGDALSAQGQRPALGLWVRSTAPACRQRPEQDDDRTLPRTAAPDTATGAR